MKIAIYPGSFNPWHQGHESIVKQAIMLFDKVIVARGINPDKIGNLLMHHKPNDKIEFKMFDGLLKDFAIDQKASVIIKGLRNAQDFEYEKIQQYWNEDLGISIPTVYIIADRSLTHISSSAIRTIDKIKGAK